MFDPRHPFRIPLCTVCECHPHPPFRPCVSGMPLSPFLTAFFVSHPIRRRLFAVTPCCLQIGAFQQTFCPRTLGPAQEAHSADRGRHRHHSFGWVHSLLAAVSRCGTSPFPSHCPSLFHCASFPRPLRSCHPRTTFGHGFFGAIFAMQQPYALLHCLHIHPRFSGSYIYCIQSCISRTSKAVVSMHCCRCECWNPDPPSLLQLSDRFVAGGASCAWVQFVVAWGMSWGLLCTDRQPLDWLALGFPGLPN